MVDLDRQLISQARAFMVDRESRHRINEMISVYQLAVELHNRQWGRHIVYEDRYERELRSLVEARARCDEVLRPPRAE